MELSIEENVKLKVVHDFLKSLGFQEDELHFESSFHLNLGRYTYRVDTEEQCRKSEPRLDILVTRNNDNLFVVEVKGELIKIGQDEIEQATSYARLVHPVAPFAIVTNGREFHIYDSLTRMEIEKGEFKIQQRYDVSITDEYCYEALKHFVGYSKENVKAFCQKQVLEGMKTLIGSKEQPYKKYIPELHSPRKGVRAVIAEFLNSGQSAFAIIGDSGTGKTCSMCAIALDLMNEGLPVLFYRARDLVHGVAESIAEDFNWEFSSQYSEIQVFRRVTELFGDERLTIFIDAIDEWNLVSKIEVFGNFLRQTAGKKLKIVLSCKTAVWDSFLSQGGMPTYLSEVIYRARDKEPGYRLQPMTGEEFHHAVDNYRQFYEFKGRFEDTVLEECKKNPFLLRVFFEVAQNLGLRDLTFSSIEFFNEYYIQILEKLGNQDVADATLKAVAKCMLDRNTDSIELDIVRRDLGLRVNETLMPELFEYNILEMVGEQSGRVVNFYFGKFRDYIVSHHVMRFQDITLQEYNAAMDWFQTNQIYQQALKFFYPVATPDKKSAIDQELRRNAEEYLNLYVEIIESKFMNLKESFAPHTKGEIGFLGELSIDKGTLVFYGFRALNEKDNERIKFVPIDAPVYDKRSNISYLHGATNLHWTSSSRGFRELDIKAEVLRNEIEEQLKSIVEKGLLNERYNLYLLLEKTIAIIAKYQARHHGIEDISRLCQHLPIDFEAIEYALRYERAARIYHDELIEKKRKEGVIKETWKGSIVSFGYTLSNADKGWIRSQAEAAARNKIYVESAAVYIYFDEAEGALSEALFHLRQQGLQAITEPIIPDVDIDRAKWIWAYYSYDTLVKYVKRIYSLFLDEYAKLIETNFSSFKEIFTLYSHMPAKCFIVIEKRGENEEHHVTIYICQNYNEKHNNEVILCDKADLVFDHERSKDMYIGQVTYLGHVYDCFSQELTGISHFFRIHGSYTNFPVAERLTTLRNLVYHQIQGELDEVINYLFRSYGVKRPY